MPRNSDLFLILFFGATFMLGPLSVDATLPGVADMADHFKSTSAEIQIGIGIYFAGFAIGQIVHGPLADRFGRRPVLVVALALFAIATIASLFTTNLHDFSIIRFIQGLMATAGSILGRAIARDIYDHEHAARVIAYMMGAGAAGPLLGPILGGFLSEHFGWESVFIFTACFSTVLCVGVICCYRETNTSLDLTAIRPGAMARNYFRFLTNRQFLMYAIMGVMSGIPLFAHLSGAGPVLLEFVGETPSAVGFQLAIVMFGFMAGGFFAGRFVGRLGLDRLIFYGCIIATVCGVAMWLFAVFDVVNAAVIVIPMTGYMFSFSLVVPQATAAALAPFGANAGAASSLFGFLQAGVGAGIAALMGILADGTQMPMVTTVALGGIGTLVVYGLAPRTGNRMNG